MDRESKTASELRFQALMRKACKRPLNKAECNEVQQHMQKDTSLGRGPSELAKKRKHPDQESGPSTLHKKARVGQEESPPEKTTQRFDVRYKVKAARQEQGFRHEALLQREPPNKGGVE